jgi:hypothetical protein
MTACATLEIGTDVYINGIISALINFVGKDIAGINSLQFSAGFLCQGACKPSKPTVKSEVLPNRGMH